MSPVFYVINCENSTAWQPISFSDMFIKGLSRDGDDWKVVNIASGDSLPEGIRSCKGIVITGSRFNCRDRDTLPWFEPLCDLIRFAASSRDIKVYGGCFGCQIIAHALGGEVDFNPDHRFLLRAEKVRFIDNSCPEPLLHMPTALHDRSRGEGLHLLVSHGDCVRVLPPGAKLLAKSDSCDAEVFIAGGNNLLAAQSHPEFDFHYAIEERIWKSVVDTRKRLTEAEAAVARKSFETYDEKDASEVMAWISAFLHS